MPIFSAFSPNMVRRSRSPKSGPPAPLPPAPLPLLLPPPSSSSSSSISMYIVVQVTLKASTSSTSRNEPHRRTSFRCLGATSSGPKLLVAASSSMSSSLASLAMAADDGAEALLPAPTPSISADERFIFVCVVAHVLRSFPIVDGAFGSMCPAAHSVDVEILENLVLEIALWRT